MCFPALLAIEFASVLLGTTAFQNTAGKYEISYGDSYLLLITGKAGVFGFAGHEHAVTASQWTARLEFDPQALARSSIVIAIPVSALVIDSAGARQLANLGAGPRPEEVQTIQARMLGPEVLDGRRYPTISLATVSIRQQGSGRLLVTGDLTLHGRTQRISAPVKYRREPAGAYVFEGDFKTRQTDFGIKPETAAGGTVKVKDEVEIRFRVSLVPVGF